MKKLVTAAMALALLTPTLAAAQPGQHPGGPRGDWTGRPGERRGEARPRWSRGDRMPMEFRRGHAQVDDWRMRGLRRPPRGYGWYRDDRGNFFLLALATGVVAEAIYQDQRDDNWNRRYQRRYSYEDDIYYRECRNQADPGRVIMGAFIGGLVGNAAAGRGDRTGSTIAGVIIGGAVGAALTRDLDCEDRSYAYRSYYDGFNAGTPGRLYRWENPRNGHRGHFLVDDYYADEQGFRCARFTQTVWIDGRPRRTNGRACKQPDDTWAVVD